MRGLAGWAIWSVPLVCAACSSGSPVAPAPFVPTIALTAATDLGPLAIRNVSSVTFSAPVTAPDATYAIDFGDGQSGRMGPNLLSKTLFAYHEYASNGAFTAQLTVVDAAQSARLATGSATILVRDMSGVWSNVQVNNATNQLETRTVQLIQTGLALSGSYTRPDGVSQSIGGHLSSPRTIELTLDGQRMAYGTDLDRAGIGNDLNTFTVFFFSSTGPVGPAVTFTRK